MSWQQAALIFAAAVAVGVVATLAYGRVKSRSGGE